MYVCVTRVKLRPESAALSGHRALAHFPGGPDSSTRCRGCGAGLGCSASCVDKQPVQWLLCHSVECISRVASCVGQLCYKYGME